MSILHTEAERLLNLVSEVEEASSGIQAIVETLEKSATARVSIEKSAELDPFTEGNLMSAIRGLASRIDSLAVEVGSWLDEQVPDHGEGVARVS